MPVRCFPNLAGQANPCRRDVFRLGLSAAVLPLVCHAVRAQGYPSRPVHLIVGLPAGSATDLVARLVGQGMSERFGQPFIVENRPGAAQNIGTEVVVHAPPDGYTLLLLNSTNAINASLYNNLNFNFMRDIVPVARIGKTLFVIATSPSLPVKTVSEFVAYAKANPGKINMASAGTGTGDHVFGALFEMMAGIKLVHVPYRSSYLPDLMSGQVHVAFIPVAQAIKYIKTGTLRGLAVAASTRAEALPEIPTVSETVPGYEAAGWQGIGAPRSTPSEIIERLNKQVNAVIADPKVKARLIDVGIEPKPMTSIQFGKFIADETEKWGKVIKFANIRPE